MSTSAKFVCVIGCVLLASTPALSADNLAQPHYKAAPAPLPGWAGAYIGGTVGYRWAESASSISAIDTVFIPFFQSQGSMPRALDSRLSGAIGGGEIGYNWQFGQWVTGLEADFSYARSASTATYDAPEIGANPATLTSHTTELSWFGTARARLGYLATPDTLLFATGGLAYGQAKVSTGIVPEPTQPCARNVLCSTGTASETLVGWTIGGGLETKIASNWTAKIEYLHFNLGTIGNTATTLTSNTFWRGTKMIGVDSDITGNIVRIGVNYQL
ncbi:outer membrane protein [Tardiphaga robiniae]|uniref:outer membrane protein n=1 Tax=Tardiphaga robiniae TaxID=943830 RepID=UPI0009D65342|nr:outer membrane protein [Tardiphaga robiniae]